MLCLHVSIINQTRLGLFGVNAAKILLGLMILVNLTLLFNFPLEIWIESSNFFIISTLVLFANLIGLLVAEAIESTVTLFIGRQVNKETLNLLEDAREQFKGLNDYLRVIEQLIKERKGHIFEAFPIESMWGQSQYSYYRHEIMFRLLLFLSSLLLIPSLPFFLFSQFFKGSDDVTWWSVRWIQIINWESLSWNFIMTFLIFLLILSIALYVSLRRRVSHNTINTLDYSILGQRSYESSIIFCWISYQILINSKRKQWNKVTYQLVILSFVYHIRAFPTIKENISQEQTELLSQFKKNIDLLIDDYGEGNFESVISPTLVFLKNYLLLDYKLPLQILQRVILTIYDKESMARLANNSINSQVLEEIFQRERDPIVLQNLIENSNIGSSLSALIFNHTLEMLRIRENDYVERKKYEEILTHYHFLHREKEMKNASILEGISLIEKLGHQYYEERKYKDAEKMYENAYEWKRRNLGYEHRDSLVLKGEIAKIYMTLKEYHVAADKYGEIVTSRKRFLEDTDESVMDANHKLAMAYGLGHDRGRGLKILEDILEERERTLGKNHINTQNTLHDIAIINKSIGKTLEEQKSLNEARVMYKKAKETFEFFKEKRMNDLGPEDRSTLETTHHLAEVCHYLRDFQRAEQLYLEVKEKREKILGSDHLDTLLTDHCLGVLHFELQNYKKAESIMEVVKKKRILILGPEHPDTKESTNMLLKISLNIHNEKQKKENTV